MPTHHRPRVRADYVESFFDQLRTNECSQLPLGHEEHDVARRLLLRHHHVVPECVILIGLPGAGKTTFYQRYFGAPHRHVSKDLWPHARRRDIRQQRLLHDAFSRGESVGVDNTNPTRLDRAQIVSIARAHQVHVIGYFFDVTTREAVARNTERTGSGKVPNVAIFTTAKRLEPPAASEGFDQLFSVRVTPDAGHDVATTQHKGGLSCFVQRAIRRPNLREV
jgi:predicted kinase